MTSQHRRELLEDLHRFEGVFEEILALQSFAKECQIDTPCILEIVKERYEAFSKAMTVELLDGKKLWTSSQADADSQSGIHVVPGLAPTPSQDATV
jgi:hypothetical protein